MEAGVTQYDVTGVVEVCAPEKEIIAADEIRRNNEAKNILGAVLCDIFFTLK